MSQYLERLKVGEAAEFKGPLGHFIYTGPGECSHSGKPGRVSHFSMIAGGTGITPMYQIMQVSPGHHLALCVPAAAGCALVHGLLQLQHA